MDFQKRLIAVSGLGDSTYLPYGIVDTFPPEINMQRARDEVLLVNSSLSLCLRKQVLTGCCDDVFRKTGIKPQDVDLLIVNCSLFNPTPSIAAMIVNKYKMRRGTRSG